MQVEKRRGGVELGARSERAGYQQRGGLCKHGAAALIVLGSGCVEPPMAERQGERRPEAGCWVWLPGRGHSSGALGQLQELREHASKACMEKNTPSSCVRLVRRGTRWSSGSRNWRLWLAAVSLQPGAAPWAAPSCGPCRVGLFSGSCGGAV